jgi:hypothetical protein
MKMTGEEDSVPRIAPFRRNSMAIGFGREPLRDKRRVKNRIHGTLARHNVRIPAWAIAAHRCSVAGQRRYLVIGDQSPEAF